MSSTPQTALRGLLLELFASKADLKVFVGDYDQEVEDAVNWDAGRTAVARDVSDQLSAHGLDDALFEALLAARGKRADEIAAVRELVLRGSFAAFDARSRPAGVHKEPSRRPVAGGRPASLARGGRRSVAVRLADEARQNLLTLFPIASAPLVDDLLHRLDWLDTELENENIEPGDAMDQLVEVSLAAAALVGETEPEKRRDLSAVLTRMNRVYRGLAGEFEQSGQLMLTLASTYWALEEEAAFRYAVRESATGTKQPSSGRTFALSQLQHGSRAIQTGGGQSAAVRSGPMFVGVKPPAAAQGFGRVRPLDRKARSPRSGGHGAVMLSQFGRSPR